MGEGRITIWKEGKNKTTTVDEVFGVILVFLYELDLKRLYIFLYKTKGLDKYYKTPLVFLAPKKHKNEGTS